MASDKYKVRVVQIARGNRHRSRVRYSVRVGPSMETEEEAHALAQEVETFLLLALSRTDDVGLISTKYE